MKDDRLVYVECACVCGRLHVLVATRLAGDHQHCACGRLWELSAPSQIVDDAPVVRVRCGERKDLIDSPDELRKAILDRIDGDRV